VYIMAQVIVVLDDPLSALGPGVVALLFAQCIADSLSDHTCVLVTKTYDVLDSPPLGS
jgi:hypothetical protein